MPFYEYECTRCDAKVIEEKTPETASEFPICTKCQTSRFMRRVFYPTPIAFKISGTTKTYRG